MRRFEELWSTWEGRLATGQSPVKLLSELTDEDVIELLTGAPPNRRLDRNILATEALNRMSRARHVIVGVARDLADELSSIQHVVAEGISAAREKDAPTTPLDELDAVNEMREAALDHIREGGLSGLHAVAARLGRESDKTLAQTRHPGMYAREA